MYNASTVPDLHMTMTAPRVVRGQALMVRELEKSMSLAAPSVSAVCISWAVTASLGLARASLIFLITESITTNYSRSHFLYC